MSTAVTDDQGAVRFRGVCGGSQNGQTWKGCPTSYGVEATDSFRAGGPYSYVPGVGDTPGTDVHVVIGTQKIVATPSQAVVSKTSTTATEDYSVVVTDANTGAPLTVPIHVAVS